MYRTPRSIPVLTAAALLICSSTAGAAPVPAATVRQLICRGQPGVQIAIKDDPSPRNSRLVSLKLTYPRSTRKIGDNHLQLEPGHCTWNPYGFENIPAEPGFVEFDLDRTGGATVPDPRNLPVYLGSEQHFWVFYVDDATNVAISHGPYLAKFWVGEDVREAGQVATATSVRREDLRCRGGHGLSFTRGASAGTNQVVMTLNYTAAANPAGAESGGLAPGTCAWVNREGARAEPGRVDFVTAGNAQLRQIQSGVTVDRSATAAERFPDANTIPLYMTATTHYWNFTVGLANPDSALAHAAWRRSVAGAYSTDKATSTAVSKALPKAPGAYSPGKAGATTQVQQVFDIRGVQVTPGLEGVVIRFEAAGGAKPTVTINTSAPAGNAPNHTFSVGQPIQLVVSGTGTSGMVRYTAASNTPLARGTRYWYVITAPEGAQARLNQSAGDFRTLAQHLTIGISDITIISDSDAESNGDLLFMLESCPRLGWGTIAGSYTNPLDWGEGRHVLGVQQALPGEGALGSVPDRFRLIIVGRDDDNEILIDASRRSFWSTWSCSRDPDPAPGSTPAEEWNSISMDFDLSKYPGTKATETFVRRSKPLQNGSKLMFEIRGYWTMERK